MSIVILASGGIDSTLMSVMAKEEGVQTYPLFVDYGQLGAAKEWTTVCRSHEEHQLPAPVRMDLSGYGRTIPCGITDRQLRVYEDAFLPGRNMLMLLAGAAYAFRNGADSVSIGLLDPETHLFPDQTEAFLRSCECTLETALGLRIGIVAPLLHLTKADVMSMAKERGITATYSCHAGGDEPCGKCVACREIMHAEEGG